MTKLEGMTELGIHRKPLTMAFRDRFDGSSIEIRAVAGDQWCAELRLPDQHFAVTAHDPVAAIVRLSYQLRELPR